MMWWDLDYSMIHDAKKYYVDNGFKYLEVPWVFHLAHITRLRLKRDMLQKA